MASVSSGSPLPGYEFAGVDSNSDSEETIWTLISNASPSAGFFHPSPAGSMASWAIVGPNGQIQPSPPALSPLNLDLDQQSFGTSMADQTAPFSVTSAPIDGQSAGSFMTPGELMFGEQVLNAADMSAFLDPYSMAMPPANGLEALEQHFQPELSPPLPQQRIQLDIPQPLQGDANQPPWNPANLKGDEPIFVMEGFVSPSPSSHRSAVSPAGSASPQSPVVKLEGSSDSRKTAMPISIRKVRGGARIEKRKSPSESPSSASSASSKFLIVTPDSVTAHAGKPNPFECFEAMRPSQRGRKGPLANETKENALQVRRLGACFCCHARKVKCDKERPCKNCKKLCAQVPQVVCWQFQDFLTVLFPEFIRGHFKKDEMVKFVTDNVEHFTVDGVEKPCTVELFSGARFSTTLSIKAKFFTAKSAEVLQHWHMQVGRNAVDLQSRGSAPIGLEMEGTTMKDEMRRKIKEYVHAITVEPAYAEQVTDSLRHTELPRKILQIVQNYSYRCDSPMVKRALSIYAMHYVMTRHLCLTRQSIVNLGSTKLVPQNLPWVTPRLLNRQVKAVVDELLMREMQVLFENFSKSLKPKSRKEWAPCLAAFLVLCLFMESVETAADTFVTSQNEVDLRNHYQPKWKRAFALDINREVENMPFKQFAYQFHQIYQTHSRDAAAKSFNPLLDDGSFQAGELEPPAVELVWQLRQFINEPYWSELDFLTADPILPNEENHPYPRDVSFNYTGRLVAKFLLSFTDEKYIFGAPI